MKLINIIFLFVVASVFSQGNPTAMPNGIRLTNLEKKEVNGDSTRIAVLDENKVFKYYIPKSDIITEAQLAWIRSQMYTNHSASFKVSPTEGERGYDTAITVSYAIVSNDDQITSASINQGIGSVLSNVNTGTKTVSGGVKSENTTYTMSIGYTRNSTSGSQNRTATYTAHIPAWYGTSSSISDINANMYEDLSALNGFTKQVISSSKMSFNLNNSTEEYVWFISSANVNKITASGFDTTIGSWGDETVFFWKKPITSFKLKNGTTTVTMYLYRTKDKINTNGSVVPFAFN